MTMTVQRYRIRQYYRSQKKGYFKKHLVINKVKHVRVLDNGGSGCGTKQEKKISLEESGKDFV